AWRIPPSGKSLPPKGRGQGAGGALAGQRLGPGRDGPTDRGTGRRPAAGGQMNTATAASKSRARARLRAEVAEELATLREPEHDPGSQRRPVRDGPSVASLRSRSRAKACVKAGPKGANRLHCSAVA